MKLEDVEKIAKELMKKHKLEDWSFGWDNAKNRFGRCQYRKKEISLSKVLTPLREEKAILNTILHEIAHAISYNCFKETGHGATWRRMFLELGGNGERCSSDKVDKSKISKYIGRCPNGHVHFRHKAPKPTIKLSCSRCCSHFNEKYLITYERNSGV